VAKYRKIPLVIEAVQISKKMKLETLEGTMTGYSGDWLITGIKGEQYFCKDDIFKATYEMVDDTTPAAMFSIPSGKPINRDAEPESIQRIRLTNSTPMAYPCEEDRKYAERIVKKFSKE
jgi:hypothetical protein